MATSKPNSTPNDSLVEEVPPAVIMNNHRQLARPPIGPLQVNPLFTFNHFVPGDDNIVPLEAAKTFVKGNLGFNVILFTGDVGSGKTHLTQAILQDYLINFPEKQAYYLFAENFANEMSACLKHHQMSDFVYKYRQACDILALEDFDFFCGKPAYEAEFIYTLEFLLNQGKKLVLTTRKSFQELNKLSPQLKSRVSASFPAQTNQPSYNDRIAILKYKAKLSNLNVSPTILEFLADRTNGDMRNLESLMMTILANSRFSKRPVTMDLAQKCLSFVQDTASNEQSTDRIIKLVCQNCHLGETDLASNSRERNIKDARAIAMYLVRNFTNLTYSNIGKVFNRKHSTTLHAIETIKNRLKNDPNLKAKLDYLTHQLINR
ncbi:MAG: hypothetical protein LBT38_07600 [Deltaproteobacteria bacterium]|nr:hypothetical protein [Deltaproteobacteria bacterium]